jgi:EAL domain-containing protein (putative c-di-GMP-specific phosphodiesterase class I)
MSCKCKNFDDIFCCKDELTLFFYESRVVEDAKNRVEKLGFVCETEAEILRVRLKDAEKDVSNICKNCGWSEMEQEGITALLSKSGEPLSFSDMKGVKPLSQLGAISESAEITDIIKNKAFTSYFQPIVDIASGEIYGYEALLRGVKTDGSILPPQQILDTARRGDMLFYLDRAARETALKTAAVKRIDKKVFINFLPTAIYNPQNCLLDTVRWAMQLEFDPKNIVFEVVETEKMIDTEHLKKILDFYKNHGFSVALDDVGSGYSSLSMLSQIRPDIIKIDREIISGIDKDEFKQSIFTALTKVAKDHAITVLAEGVETLPEAEWLTDSGAHLAQGYFWGKPTAEPIRTLG